MQKKIPKTLIIFLIIFSILSIIKVYHYVNFLTNENSVSTYASVKEIGVKTNDKEKQENLLKKQRAEETIEYCMEALTKSCYEKSKKLVNQITDREIRENLNQELNELLKKVLKKEEQKGKELVQKAEEKMSYDEYEIALKKVESLTDINMKNSLLNRLELVKEKLSQKEILENKTISIIGITIIIILIIMLVCLYYYCDKEEDSTFKVKYLKEFPNHFSPSTVSYLFHKRITKKAFTAEILDLIYKKAIIIEEVNANDFKMKKNFYYKEPLSAKETAIMDLLFEQEDNIKLSVLSKKGQHPYSSVLNNWDVYEKNSLKEALTEKLYVEDSMEVEKKLMYPASWGVLLFFLSIIVTIFFPILFILCFVFSIFIWSFNRLTYQAKKLKNKEQKIKLTFKIIAIFLIVVSIIIILYINTYYHFIFFAIPVYLLVILLSFSILFYIPMIRNKTKLGKEEYQKWQAFKKYLKHFDNREQRKLPEIHLLEQYLVYATVLGCERKLVKTIKLKVNDLNANLINSLDLVSKASLISRAVKTSIESAYRFKTDKKHHHYY